MKVLFKNNTIYTTEEYNRFLLFHDRKYRLSYNLYSLSVFFLFIFCSIVNFLYYNIDLGILFLLTAFGFIAYRVFRPFFLVNKESNIKKVTSRLENTYYFYKDYFYVTNRNTDFNYNYHKLYRVFETKDCFYLYIDKDYAFLLSKKTFLIGLPDDFSNFIRKKMLFKYRKNIKNF
ncbi:MAG: YcxB family protein [Clostridia bacterium]|jgi:hypothetical protein|nr:YcxB family protein [Clostridia bacterium]